MNSATERYRRIEEEEIILSTEEKDRQLKLLDSVFNPELHRADIHQLIVKEEEDLPKQQERSSNLKQENPAETAHIKEEQEEVWINHGREQLKELEEDDIIKLRFSLVPVKSEEDDEEKPQSFQLDVNQSEENRDTEHLKTEADGEGCGGSEPDRDFNSHSHLHAVSPDKISHLSRSDTDDSADWEESDEPREGSNPQQDKDRAVSGLKCNTRETSVSSVECAQIFGQKNQQEHKGNQTSKKPFSCSVCGSRYSTKKHLQENMHRHSSEKPYGCSFCMKSFIFRNEIVKHMRVHTGEKPFSCPVCGKSFTQSAHLKRHSTVHTGDKPFGCIVCGKRFSNIFYQKEHTFTHTRENPYSCPVCGKCFNDRRNLRRHSFIHTGQKPFCCSVCGKRFTQNETLKTHSLVHSGKKPFSCSICGKRYTQLVYVKQHKCAGESGGI